MKFHLLKSVISIMFILALVTPALADPVFMDLSWRDSAVKLGESFVVSSDDPGKSVLRKRGEVTALGTMPVSTIEYTFFQDRLMQIVVYANTGDVKEDYEGFELMLTARYGTPKSRFLSHTKDWTVDDTQVTLVWPIFGDVHFKLVSIPLEIEYKSWLDAYKKEQAAQNATAW